VAEDELSRLMKKAVAADFTEPLLTLRACADALGRTPASKADVLCMCIATQMVEHSRQKRIYSSVAAAFGWDEDPNEQAAFASGLSSRMHELLEAQLLLCPPTAWKPWLQTQWSQLFPVAVTRRLVGGPSECAAKLLGELVISPSLEVEIGRVSESDWRDITEKVLAAGPPVPNLSWSAAQISLARAGGGWLLLQKLRAPTK
jgi:hypothetical protein